MVDIFQKKRYNRKGENRIENIDLGGVMDIKEGFMNSITEAESISISKDKLIIKIETIIKKAIDIIGAIVGILLLIPLTIIVFLSEKICRRQRTYILCSG